MITLMQLYNYAKSENIDLFEGFSLPSDTVMSRDIVINTILERCGMNTPIYADPSVFKSAVTIWSAKNQYTFEHVNKIYIADYSPIENTDRYETITVDHTRDMSDNTKGDSTRNESVNGTKHETTKDNKSITNSGTDTTVEEDTTSAYNSGSYQNADRIKTDLTHGAKTTESDTITDDSTANSKKNIVGNQNTDKTVNESEKTTTTTHTHGNIGVTSNTTLIEEDYSLMANYNPYNFISGLFENELTICIY